MKTDILTIKIKPEIKEKAMTIAEDLGFSISALVNAYLIDLVKNQTVHFSAKLLEPTPELLASLKEAEEERKKGNVSPTFGDIKEAVEWLNNPKRKYVSDL